MGVLSREKSTVCNNFIQKGGLFLWVGVFSKDYRIYVLVSIAMATELSLHISEPLENPTKAVDTIYESIYYLQSHCFVEYVKAHTRWPQLRAYTHVAQCVCAKDKDSTDNGCFSYKPWRS